MFDNVSRKKLLKLKFKLSTHDNVYIQNKTIRLVNVKVDCKSVMNHHNQVWSDCTKIKFKIIHHNVYL